eukprot:TRINITY_DN25402_c0_g1_i1.p1 TRINITY_DN25402_c0_g1~~TRINITY_DN25402_c0_g1_i1.p1  ORF type:complete len:213 (+),score=-14.55 TRINITY_DN25402_c0_g1_i1:112-750(+)
MIFKILQPATLFNSKIQNYFYNLNLYLTIRLKEYLKNCSLYVTEVLEKIKMQIIRYAVKLHKQCVRKNKKLVKNMITQHKCQKRFLQICNKPSKVRQIQKGTQRTKMIKYFKKQLKILLKLQIYANTSTTPKQQPLKLTEFHKCSYIFVNFTEPKNTVFIYDVMFLPIQIKRYMFYIYYCKILTFQQYLHDAKYSIKNAVIRKLLIKMQIQG